MIMKKEQSTLKKEMVTPKLIEGEATEPLLSQEVPEDESKVNTIADSPIHRIFSKEMFEKAVPCAAKPNISTRSGSGGGIVIVNSKNGIRVEFCKAILSILGNPERVTFLFLDDSMIIKNSADNNGFHIRPMGVRKVIYSADLVKEVTEKYSLDFSSCCCKSFSEYNTFEGVDNAVAIQMK